MSVEQRVTEIGAHVTRRLLSGGIVNRIFRMFQFTSKEFGHQMISVYPTIKRQRRVFETVAEMLVHVQFPKKFSL